MSASKTLFVSRLNHDQTKFHSGGDTSSKVFLDYYKVKLGSKVDVFFVGFLRIRFRFVNRLLVLYNVLSGRLNGLTPYKVKRFKELINSGLYCSVIFDSSLYGELVEYANKRGLKTVVIYQNLEIDYFTGQFLFNRWFDFVMLKKAHEAELKSSEWANESFFLTDYDLSRAIRFYKFRGDVQVSKILLNKFFKNFSIEGLRHSGYSTDDFYFVGSNNAQNVNALKNIIGCSEIRPLHVFGSVCSFMSSFDNRLDDVYFHGEVDDLNSRIKRLKLVAPLYGGSGIKLKIIEAIANGSQVITTIEGVSGLEFALESKVVIINDFSTGRIEIPLPNWVQFQRDLTQYLNN